MGEINYLSVAVRWIHISSVIVLVGGAFFLRYVVMPAAADLPEEAHNSLRKWVTNKWKMFVHPLVALIVISGIYNLVVRVTTVEPVWHAIFTLKLVFALYVLFVASALVGRSKALEPLREKSPRFLAINIVMAAVIVLLSNVMKNIPEKKKDAPETTKAGVQAVEGAQTP
jgi:uncharacterized membrane protein